jgi:hypothetical protein
VNIVSKSVFLMKYCVLSHRNIVCFGSCFCFRAPSAVSGLHVRQKKTFLFGYKEDLKEVKVKELQIRPVICKLKLQKGKKRKKKKKKRIILQ